MAISLMLSAKKGLSSLQLSRDISVNKNTAWLLQMKIRAAMNEGSLEVFTSKNQVSKKERKDYPPSNIRAERGKLQGVFSKNKTFGYWSLLKRAIIGQYHKIEPHYLMRYIDEINFKLNRKHLKDHGYLELIDRLLFLTLAK
ncbi:MAG: transposase [Crocinitomicaceae bacterium]|nr:transposase [Crocinitomicaceae bacterium]